MTSIEDCRSSSTKTAIGSPFLVNFRWRLVMTPPTVTIVPSSRSRSSATVASDLRRSARSAPSSGWSLT